MGPVVGGELAEHLRGAARAASKELRLVHAEAPPDDLAQRGGDVAILLGGTGASFEVVRVGEVAGEGRVGRYNQVVTS